MKRTAEQDCERYRELCREYGRAMLEEYRRIVSLILSGRSAALNPAADLAVISNVPAI